MGTENTRANLAKATRRPWRVTRGVVPSIDRVERVIVEAVHRSTERGGYVVANCGPVGEYGSDNDARLIVDVINKLDALLDVVDLAEQIRFACQCHIVDDGKCMGCRLTAAIAKVGECVGE